MNCLQQDPALVLKGLKDMRYQFPRAAELQREFDACILHHRVGQMLHAEQGVDFEARGLLVTGDSRLGKTTEIKKIIDTFNHGENYLIDGRKAKIITCNLSGTVTWKTLGIRTLRALGYEVKPARSMEYIWGLVVHQMRGQGVVGIHYDECQHAFKTPKPGRGRPADDDPNRILLDSFKTLMKDMPWPAVLIFSGVPELSRHIARYGQLDDLLNPIQFENIDLDAVRNFWMDTDEGLQEVERSDRDELLSLLFSYFDFAGIDFTPLSSRDFLNRLVHACASKWGLIIELVIEVLTFAQMRNTKVVTVADFAFQFSRRSRIPADYSPFTHPNYREAFDSLKLLEKIDVADREKAKRKK